MWCHIQPGTKEHSACSHLEPLKNNKTRVWCYKHQEQHTLVYDPTYNQEQQNLEHDAKNNQEQQKLEYGATNNQEQ